MDWLSIARELGLPATFMAALLVGLYRAGKWTGKELLVPTRNRYFLFLDGMVKASKEHADALNHLVDLAKRQQEAQEKHASTIDAIWLSLNKGSEP